MRVRTLLSLGIFNKTFVEHWNGWPSRWVVIIKKSVCLKAKSTESNPPLSPWNPAILLWQMSSPFGKFVECSHEEIVQANFQPKSDICHICRVFTRKEHGRCYLVRFHCRFPGWGWGVRPIMAYTVIHLHKPKSWITRQPKVLSQ